MNDTWFTGDLHFDDPEMVKHRPFDTIEEMNAVLIENHNKVVKKGDLTVDAGDFAFDGSIFRLQELNKILNGTRHLITGNHDRSKKIDQCGFGWTGKRKNVNIGDQRIVIHHYALRTWHGAFNGAWHLYGHSHGGLKPLFKSFDIGVDCHNYRPLNFDEVKAIMDTLEPWPFGKDDERETPPPQES